jgi:diguanylate cyclase (GGDEF)-like protein/PAS domain S-box-containing protein
MIHPAIERWFSKGFAQLPLRTFLALPFVLQTIGAVGTVGYLSWQAGQQAVNGLATQLMGEISDRTRQHLGSYTSLPLKVANIVASDLESGQIRLDGKDLKPYDAYFLNRVRTFEEMSFIYVGTADGKFLGAGPRRSQPLGSPVQAQPSYILEVADGTTKGSYFSYIVNAAGQRVQKIDDIPNYNVKQRPWYQTAVGTNKLSWSSIYPSIGQPNPGLTLTASRPYYVGGKLAGVAAVDLFLSDVNGFLSQLPLRERGQVFIVESNGNLIGSSSTASTYRVNGDRMERLSAIDSADPVVRGAMQAVKNRVDVSRSFSAEIDGQQRFVQVTPWRDQSGLNWQIVVVMPVSEFKSQITRNVQNTMLLCGLTLLGTIALGYATSRWVTKPIFNLSEAAKEIASGKRKQPIEQQSSEELGELANSFNRLSARLQNSLNNLQTLNQELFNSKQRLYQLLEALPVGVIVFDPTGECLFLNQTGQLLLGLKQVPQVSIAELAARYHIYRAGTPALYPTEELPIVQALQGKAVFVDDLEIRIRNMVIPLEVRAIPVLNSQNQVIYAIQTFQNVIARKTAEADKEVSEKRMQRLTDNVPGVIYRLVWHPDDSHELVYISPRCREVLGVEPEVALADMNVMWAMILPEDEVEIRRLAPIKSAELQPWSFDYRVRQANGEIKWIQNQASPELAEDGDVYWDGLMIDISDRKQAEAVLSDYRVHLEQQVQERTIALQEANQELERLATLDGLTQVANRRRFDLYLAQEWQRLARDQQILSLILCDVDYFKRYNDCYGHQAGDYCLQIVARAMKSVIKRPADLLARYGGEEFAVILPQTNRWGAMQVAETLRQAILEAEIPHADSHVSDYVTLSVGVATVLPSQLNSIEELIADADRALYQAKQMGRDRICFAEPSVSGNVANFS